MALREPARQGFVNQPPKDGGADTLSPPGSHDRHTPDLAVGRQSSRTDGSTVRVLGNHVDAACIRPVPFQFPGNALFEDEDGLANAADGLQVTGEFRPAHPVCAFFHD